MIANGMILNAAPADYTVVERIFRMTRPPS